MKLLDELDVRITMAVKLEESCEEGNSKSWDLLFRAKLPALIMTVARIELEDV